MVGHTDVLLLKFSYASARSNCTTFLRRGLGRMSPDVLVDQYKLKNLTPPVVPTILHARVRSKNECARMLLRVDASVCR